MAVLKIALYPEEEKLLRSRAKPVVKITPKTQRLIDDMVETMHDAAGVGLAAPQVFVSERIFVYDIGKGAEALINPEIIHSDGEEVGTEGCLSMPRVQGDVKRATRLTVTGINRKGSRVRIDAEDYLARVFQHEIDHLNGVMFTDRAEPKSIHLLTEEQEAERRTEGRRRRREGVVISRGRRASADPAPAE